MADSHDDHRHLPARYPQAPEPRYPTPQHDVFGHPGYPGDDEDAIHLRDYWRVLVVRRWTVVAVLLTVVTVTAIGTFKQTPIYSATTRIQIDRENPNVLPFQDMYQMESLTDDALQTQFEILASRSLARLVIEDLRLLDHPELEPQEPGVLGSVLGAATAFLASETEQARAPTESEEMRRAIDFYLGRLSVAPVRQSRLADVSFESPDPEFAASVINAHTQHFIEQNLQFRFDATEEAARFLEGRVGTLQADLERKEDQLLDYTTGNDILFTQEGRNSALDNLQQITQEYTIARADRIQKESYQNLIAARRTDALPQVRNNGLISNLSDQLIDLRTREAELAVTAGPLFPELQRLRRQIEELESSVIQEEQRIVRTVEAEYDAAVLRETLLLENVEAQREIVFRVNEDMVQYDILRREADSMQTLYDSMLGQLQEAGVSGTLRASNIRIVDRAEVPSGPVRPRTAMNLALGLMAGLTFGVGLAFFQDYMDNTIKSPDDVARYLGVPTIAAVPKREALKGNGVYGNYVAAGSEASGGNGSAAKNGASVLATGSRIEMISHDAPNSVMAEAYRSMRTSLLLSSADHPPKTILVTSALPSEGKTVTAVNMAISLTQTGGRVVLVDADMRKPRIHSVFALGATPGLSAVLTGSAGLKDVVHEVSIPNLFVLPCGVIPPNPAELLMSQRFERMLAALREYFDYVVIDSPPVSNVTDARIIGRVTDSTLVVVKAWSTPRAAAEHSVGALVSSRTRVTGIVLNDIDVRSRGYDAYYSGYSGYSGQYYATRS